MITQILEPSPPFRRRPFRNRADFFSLDRRWGAARQMAHCEELAVFPGVFCCCVSFSFVFARKVDRIVPLSTTGSGAGFCLFCRNLRGLPVVSFQQLLYSFGKIKWTLQPLLKITGFACCWPIIRSACFHCSPQWWERFFADCSMH